MADRPTLLEVAAQLHREERGELPEDPAERADRLAKLIHNERPDVKVRSAQNAAAKEVGIDPPPSSSEADRLLASERRPSRPARTARRSARKVTRRRGFTSLGLSPGRSSIGGLLAQMLGLVALYWVLRTPNVIAAVTSGLARGLRWIREPTPIGGNE